MTKKATTLPAEFRRQWIGCKQQYPDVIFLVGGVGNLTYYTFAEDADRIRDHAHVRSVGEQVVAVGSEHTQPIIAALVAAGMRVALADQ